MCAYIYIVCQDNLCHRPPVHGIPNKSVVGCLVRQIPERSCNNVLLMPFHTQHTYYQCTSKSTDRPSFDIEVWPRKGDKSKASVRQRWRTLEKLWMTYYLRIIKRSLPYRYPREYRISTVYRTSRFMTTFFARIDTMMPRRLTADAIMFGRWYPHVLLRI